MPAKKSSKSKNEVKPKLEATKPSAKNPVAKTAAPEKSEVAKKAPAKKPAGAPAMGTPLIDTSLAAQNAAAMLGSKFATRPTAGSSLPESAMFKQLKSGLNKSHSSAMNSLLDKSHGPDPKKSGLPFNKQSGHSQTSSDVARINVPRRTNG